MDTQIKKGILELCILQCIAAKDLYGYDIIQQMHVYFPEVGESAFYAILRRLNKEGAASTYTGTTSGGPARKYYRITEQGQARLKEMKNDWNRLKAIMEDMGIS